MTGQPVENNLPQLISVLIQMMCGAIHVYMAAGTVLRCPHCEAVVMKVVTDGERIWVDVRGLRTLALAPI